MIEKQFTLIRWQFCNNATLFSWSLSLSTYRLKKKPNKPYCLLSYLSVTHTGCSNEGLLDGLALLKHPLLLAGHCPVTLNQKLDDLQMTSECSMDQSTLSILIQVIHLREGDREICVNEEWGCIPILVISSHCTAWSTKSQSFP